MEDGYVPVLFPIFCFGPWGYMIKACATSIYEEGPEHMAGFQIINPIVYRGLFTHLYLLSKEEKETVEREEESERPPNLISLRHVF